MNDPGVALQRIAAALRAADSDAIMACFAADSILEVGSDPDRRVFTNQGIRDAIDALIAGFEDLKLTPSSRRVSPSRVVEESVFSGVHRGVFAGVAPARVRVHVSVRLTAESGPDSTLQSLWVDADAPALFAQIAGTEDIMGVTGGMVATVRERYDGAVRVTDETKQLPTPARARAGPSLSRRRWFAAVGLVLAAAFLTWTVVSMIGGQDAQTPRPGLASAVTATPSAKVVRASPRRAPPLSRGTPGALPIIATAAPKAVPHVQAGKQLVLNSDVLFGFDSASLTAAATAALNRLSQQVRNANVTGTIQINGYTDNLGSVGYDLALSRARALAVARVLQSALAGRPVTLVPQGFGHANPVAPNTNDAGRARNRRVTIVLPTPG
jgi:outer membrane protein OmpA-like peptidoglycan-associated protein